MKLLIASDIHGSIPSCQKLLEAYAREKADKMVLLGDYLYHGPRNSLPEAYGPDSVIGMLNGAREHILAVRGNCDAEIDQMLLKFPTGSDSMTLFIDGLTLFATHGHLFNEDCPPPLRPGEILLHGHTHICMMKKADSGTFWVLNPGSVSLPRMNNPRTYMTYENHEFALKTLDGEMIQRMEI